MEGKAGRRSLGFIGVGRMGRAMATNLVKAGHEVRVYDRNRSAMEAMREVGAVLVDLEELVKQSEAILLSLPNPTIVEDVILGPRGLLNFAHPGQLVIDLSSSTPHSEQKIARQAGSIGVEYLDAPVSGGVPGAIAGSLTIMVGGEAKSLERARPLLEVIGKKIIHVGPVGAGQAAKLVNQLLFGLNLIAVSEGLQLAESLGLDRETVFEIVSGSSGNSYAWQTRCSKFIFAGNYEPGFSLELAAKDIRLAVEAALQAGQPLVFGSLGLQLYEAARNKGYGSKDIAAIYSYMSEHLGRRLEEGK